MPVDVDVASEFRYREPPLEKGGLALFISQSGETADTLAALRYCAGERPAHRLDRQRAEVDDRARERRRSSRPLRARRSGSPRPRRRPRSSRCWRASRSPPAARGVLRREDEAEAGPCVDRAAEAVCRALEREPQIETIAKGLSKAKDVLYLGRGPMFPVAMEGALKLKEISYIHAEGYAAGELKHGPIALVDEVMPVIVVAPYDQLMEKTLSNMQEVAARGGKIILITDAEWRKGM